MAEIFGIIAGGIRAGSLAIQIIEKADKLHILLKSIKDNQREVHEMLMELELLTNTLSETEDLYQRELQKIISKSAARTLKLC